ncbi:MAG: Sir2 family NAD-dependent protein deacetylase [Bacteroidota bacterium]|nr:Sir2 family NAD-dependent protein deacetylase [Bacteroidota bacterium]
MSAESGIKTFRDSGGLWEEYKVEDVATLEAWERNKELVTLFYNQRRKQVMEAQPNEAHKIIADLQKIFDVTVITQNVDNLHERAGSKSVIHLHGEIVKAQSSLDPSKIYNLKNWEIKIGDTCELGSQLRPYIVWFGEMVPLMEPAIDMVGKADLFTVIGTSLNVYPAAGLVNYTPSTIPKWLVDPGDFNLEHIQNIEQIKDTAVSGMKKLKDVLMKLK